MSALIGDADTDKTTVHTAIEGAHVAAGGRRFVPLAPTTQAREAMVEKRAFRLKTSGAARGFARVADHIRQVAAQPAVFRACRDGADAAQRSQTHVEGLQSTPTFRSCRWWMKWRDYRHSAS